ncbi:37S ribosomal protein S10 [Penicillium canariense]|uniref:Small ribosomal subunit protein uS10m n=1 Tax=Penicillium canariense TaxID=189055 RepID=A0A9W9I7P2_9EURO|nr:37S ribosomal protein S10 [Penicillium canariense]KAJ5166502.1 37S ribosomal protein S10 [Penicillium canariense]
MFPSTRSLIGAGKRLRVPMPIRALSTPSQSNAPSTETTTTPPQAKLEPTPTPTATTNAEQPSELRVKEWSERLGAFGEHARLPRSVQALYLRPLRRKAEYGLPVCDLQLRSYSVQNLEFFADFAIRAAYYLNLPVSGPVPLPRITERWTVTRSNFVHKKSKENFERITLRRLIQIKDGNPQAVQAWLAFLRKHAFYGVGMKANVWESESLGMIPRDARLLDRSDPLTPVTDAGKALDASLSDIQKTVGPHLAQFGQRHDNTAKESIFDSLDSERFAERKNL